jgi:hypothetical protein
MRNRPIIPRREPMIITTSVLPRLAAAIETTLERFPAGISAALRGRPGGCWPGWTIRLVPEISDERRTVFGHCQPLRDIVDFARPCLTFPDEALVALVAHELIHAHWFITNRDWWAVEEDINDKARKLGFDVEALFAAARQYTRRQPEMTAAFALPLRTP